MRKIYENVYFNNVKLDGIINATLENDMSTDNFLGNISILEEKIPGRDVPYFFGIEREPLGFSLVFAFEKNKTKSEIVDIVRKLFNNNKYKKLQFSNENGEYSPIYEVIFVGEPSLSYQKEKNRGGNYSSVVLGKNPQDSDYRVENFYSNETLTDGYVGFLTVEARCNAPYGYVQGKFKLGKTARVENINTKSDLDSDNYIIRIENKTNNKIENYGIKINEEAVFFSEILPLETIVIYGNLKRIVSSLKNSRIYERWNNKNGTIVEKIFPKFLTGFNEFSKISSETGLLIEDNNILENLEVSIEYKLPKLI